MSDDFFQAQALETAGRYDEAWATYQAANEARRAGLSPAGFLVGEQERLDTIRSVFTPDFIRLYQGQGHPSVAPIFIVGMPRSGSTLVEQILISHSRVNGMGEIQALREVMRGLFPYPLTGRQLSRHFHSVGGALP